MAPGVNIIHINREYHCALCYETLYDEYDPFPDTSSGHRAFMEICEKNYQTCIKHTLTCTGPLEDDPIDPLVMALDALHMEEPIDAATN